MRRGRALHDDFLPESVRGAYTLAIARAARDAHSSACDRDVVECTICQVYADAIAKKKRGLNVSWHE